MITITSHTLNGIDGTHAGGISVSLNLVGRSAILKTARTDNGGRLSIEIDPSEIDINAKYELVFNTAPYWRDQEIDTANAISEIVLRFEFPDPVGNIHMPIIISPNTYSTWKSG